MKPVFKRLMAAYERDRDIVCNRDKVEETLGSDPGWLGELGLTNSDLIRLERLGLAIKARYATANPNKGSDKSGPHRVRWIIFEEAVR